MHVHSVTVLHDEPNLLEPTDDVHVSTVYGNGDLLIRDAEVSLLDGVRTTQQK